MRLIAVFLLIFSPLLVAQTPAPPPTATPSLATSSEAFAKGLDAFQKNDFAASRLYFRDSAAKDPSQIVTWYNLGLAEQRLGRNGVAMAFWRKALSLRPSFQPAERALIWTKPKLEKSDIPHDVEMWENLRVGVLTVLSVYQFALLTAVLFFAAGWLLLVYVGRRRRAILDEKSLPSFPFAGALIAVLFFASFTLTICKIIDEQDLRATVIVKKAEAKALPDPTSTTLFELYEGLEVIVRQSRTGWIQVTYPGGATGWIARSAVFTTADRISP